MFPIPAVKALDPKTAANSTSRPSKNVDWFISNLCCSPSLTFWEIQITVVVFSSVLCWIRRFHLEELFRWAEIRPLFIDILFFHEKFHCKVAGFSLMYAVGEKPGLVCLIAKVRKRFLKYVRCFHPYFITLVLQIILSFSKKMVYILDPWKWIFKHGQTCSMSYAFN